jgi:hypothetical protein
MHDSASLQIDDPKDVALREERGANNGGVAGPKVTGVILQESGAVWLEPRRISGMYVGIERLQTRTRRCSSSPRMRWEPHNQFTLARFLIRAIISGAIRDFLILVLDLRRR